MIGTALTLFRDFLQWCVKWYGEQGSKEPNPSNPAIGSQPPWLAQGQNYSTNQRAIPLRLFLLTALNKHKFLSFLRSRIFSLSASGSSIWYPEAPYGRFIWGHRYDLCSLAPLKNDLLLHFSAWNWCINWKGLWLHLKGRASLSFTTTTHWKHCVIDNIATATFLTQWFSFEDVDAGNCCTRVIFRRFLL